MVEKEIGSGALTPKMNHNFILRFFDNAKEPCNGLSRQIVAITDIKSSSLGHNGVVSAGSLKIIFEDDVQNAAWMELIRLGGIFFDMRLDILDSCETIIQSKIFSACRVTGFDFSNYGYRRADTSKMLNDNQRTAVTHVANISFTSMKISLQNPET